MGAWCDVADRCGTFVDSRDSKVSKWTRIETQKWMAQNLNFETGPNGMGTASWCFDDDPVNCDRYGRLYTWGTLMAGAASSNRIPSGVPGICPPGWHVPSDGEWKMLEAAFGMPAAEYDATDWRGTDEGTKMKAAAPDWNGTDAFGFAALPSGTRISTFNGAGNNINGSTSFWTSTDYNFNSYTYNRYLYSGEPRIGRDYYLIEAIHGYAARCVED
jgi:uncharacterized protein (TIGR02145 family)